MSIFAAPAWAGLDRPDPVALGHFAQAAARRFDGRGGRPRVRYWQVWNEPNLKAYLDQSGAAARYRRMVNAMSAGVKAVHSSNQVVAGGLAPFGGPGALGSDSGSYGTRPLPFMRRLLCVSDRGRRTCGARIRFDVWAHHPYTSGGPTRQALQPGDVSIGDLGEMKRVLDGAAGRQRSLARHPSVLGDRVLMGHESARRGRPPTIAARTLGVRGALPDVAQRDLPRHWFQLRDLPRSSSVWQSGLYFADGSSKPALRAFRFPFVAFTSGRSVKAWGRTPAADPRSVLIEQRRSGRWRRIGSTRADIDGIFQARLDRYGSGRVRARLAGFPDVARPFSLSRPRDRNVNPFGTGAPPE